MKVVIIVHIQIEEMKLNEKGSTTPHENVFVSLASKTLSRGWKSQMIMK